jgi:hypothetical protein
MAVAVLALALLTVLFRAGPAIANEMADGMNYVVVNPDLNRLREDSAWRDSQIFVTPGCGYDTASDRIQADLRRMRSAGLTKLGLIIWHMAHSTAAECSGFTVGSNGGRFPRRFLQNIALFLEQAKADGYDEVQIRFAPMGANSPYKWKGWDENKFDENWSVIRTTVAQLKLGRTPRLIFELGAEFAGTTCGACLAYVTRMWKNYVDVFGSGDSYGFSVAVAPGRVTRLIQTLRAGGPMPDEIALDVYSGARNEVMRAAVEAKAAGIAEPNFLIQETYYADPDTLEEIREGARLSGARIRAIIQWPVTPGAKRNISVARPYDKR